MKEIFDWYLKEMGYKAADKFRNHKIIYFIENEIIHIVYIWDNRQSIEKMGSVIL